MSMASVTTPPPIALTPNGVASIFSGVLPSEIQPLVQVINVRAIGSVNQGSGSERYRISISDGTHFSQGMLSTQLNELVRSGSIGAGSVVKLVEFVFNLVQNRPIIIIANLEVVHDKCEPIGKPTPYPYSGDGTAPPVARTSMPSQSTFQPAPKFINPQSYGGSMAGPAPRPSSDGIPFAGNMVSGRNATANVQPSYQKPVYGNGVPRAPGHAYVNHGPAARNEPALKIMPIAALNPFQGRWSIKARVTSKSELRHYSNARGNGSVLSFDLLDAQGGEIRATCFSDLAERFNKEIDQGKVYIISNGMLKTAQKNYNHLPNEHEIVLDKSSTVQSCPDDTSIQHQQFRFRRISEIEGLDNGSVIDIIGIVSSVSPSISITRKDGKVTQKRSLQLTDMSGRSVEVTMWGNFCDAEGQKLESMCDSEMSPVLALKSGRVTEFNGKSVGTVANSTLMIDPESPEAQQLRVWFDAEGKTTPVISLSKPIQGNYVRKTISQIQDEKLGTSERADLITVVATVTFIKQDNFYYNACRLQRDGRQCNKKVTDNGDGTWHCGTCDKTMSDPDRRYILQLAIQDHTGQVYVTAFQESGADIMGHPADHLYKMKEEGEDEQFDEVIRSVQFSRFLFKLRVKAEVYNDEQRVKSTVAGAEKLAGGTFITETKYLLDAITKLGQEDTGSVPPKSVNNFSAPTAAGFSGMNSNVIRASGAYTAQTGERGNQYDGISRFSTGATTYSNCTSCGGSGHNAANCPSLMSAPRQSYGEDNSISGPNISSASECFKCHQFGHWARDCPGTGNVPPAYGGNNAARGGAPTVCFKCDQPGHFARECPGTTNAAPAYSSSNSGSGRYYTNQRVSF